MKTIAVTCIWVYDVINKITLQLNFSLQVVASMDAHPSRYSASVRVQKNREEVIVDMASMVRDLLLEFYIATNYKPWKIVVYRDGVHEGQYNKVC